MNLGFLRVIIVFDELLIWKNNISHEIKMTIERNVIMFAGKGGVGKTTSAAATALHNALSGERTLAISTDPTPSLGHIFEVANSIRPAKILNELFMDEIGVENVKQMWDRKFGREVYEVFSSFVAIEYTDFADFMSSILPGIRDEFMVDYIREMAVNGEYKNIIWDTAPLGQTLGLLKMPSLLAQHLKAAPRIYSKLKIGKDSRRPVLDILKNWEILSAKNIIFLQENVKFVIVTIPEFLAIEQLDGIFTEFARYELKIDKLIVNNVITDTTAPFLISRADQQKRYIDILYGKYPDIPIVELPMFPSEIKGMDRLQDIRDQLFK